MITQHESAITMIFCTWLTYINVLIMGERAAGAVFPWMKRRALERRGKSFWKPTLMLNGQKFVFAALMNNTKLSLSNLSHSQIILSIYLSNVHTFSPLRYPYYTFLCFLKSSFSLSFLFIFCPCPYFISNRMKLILKRVPQTHRHVVTSRNRMPACRVS